jgi:RHS repeat-associated protein
MGTVRYTTVDGEVIAEERGGVRSLYVPDPLGSTVALLDNTQAQTDTFEYWPYGEVRTRTGATATPLQFVGTAGYYRDSASRTYVRARTLDTQKGRWLTTDPVGFDAGDVNLYRYAANMAVTLTDPSGMDFAIGYCGPNMSRKYDPCKPPGKRGKPPFDSPTPKPRNPVDGCCRDHDCCWLKISRRKPPLNHNCIAEDKYPACVQCNITFCKVCVPKANCGSNAECQLQKELALAACDLALLPTGAPVAPPFRSGRSQVPGSC